MVRSFLAILLFSLHYPPNLTAQSSAWRGYVSYFDTQNAYLTETNLNPCSFVNNGEMRILPTSTNKSLYWTNFEYKAPICTSNNFSYEVRFKNNSAINGFSAYDAALGLLTPEGLIGCTLMGDPIGQQWTNIVIAEQAVALNKPYLVINMTDWVTIKLSVQNNVISLYHNNTLLFSAPYSVKICTLNGFSFRFKGSGAIDWIRITNNEDQSVVYYDDFMSCSPMSSPAQCSPSINLSANTPCEGDTLKLATSQKAVQYEWTGPNNFTSTLQNPIIPKANSAFNGIYTLKAQFNACQTATQTVNVKVNSLPVVNLGKDTSLCSGQSLLLNAGNSGTVYRWQNNTTGRFLNANTSGNYSVTVTNTEGCKASDTIKISVAPSPITPTVSIKKPTCYGRCDGEALANAKGGFGAPYSYTWSGGRTTQGVIARCAGDITLTVTDSKGCKIATVVSVSQPPKIDAEAIPDTIYNGYAVRCANSEDGQATVKPSGGAGGYTVVWKTDPLQVERTAKGLKANTEYKVFVYDKNGCHDSAVVSLKAPPTLEADFTIKNVRCFGEKNGSVTIDSIKGGIAPYSFVFNDKKYTLDNTQTFGSLPDGNYLFEIRDSNNCSVQKELNIQNPPKLKIISTSDTIIHFGDDVPLYATLDTPSVLHSVKWIPMKESMEIGCKECRITLSSPRTTAVYKVIVKDTFGCQATKDILVRVDKNRKIFVPNAFSPNDDGQNDAFMVYAGTGTKRILNFVIFNRWGTQIFQARDFSPNDDSKAWDGYFNGSIVADGTYVWVAEIEFEDGDREIFKGDVVIMK